MRIADQVIEEVDEQLTVTSNRGQEKRPTAQSLFATNNEKLPVRSAPIDVPGSNHITDTITYDRVQSVAPEHSPYLFPNNEIFSSSVPDEHLLHIPTPTINVNLSNDLKPSPTMSNGKDGIESQTFQ